MKSVFSSNLYIAIILTAAYLILNIIFFSKTEILSQNGVKEIIPIHSVCAGTNTNNQTPDNNLALSLKSPTQPQLTSSHILTNADIEKSPRNNSNNLPEIINNNYIPEITDEIFTVVEDYPSFPGGEIARMKFLQDNVHYPKEALQNHFEGRVVINFIVEKDGSVSNVKVLDSIGKGCDEEVLRVAKLMPKWKPGKQNGLPVRVRFNMCVTFRLKI